MRHASPWRSEGIKRNAIDIQTLGMDCVRITDLFDRSDACTPMRSDSSSNAGLTTGSPNQE
jgi:hypothetical protein